MILEALNLAKVTRVSTMPAKVTQGDLPDKPINLLRFKVHVSSELLMQFSQDKKVRVRSVRSTPAAVTRPGKPRKTRTQI